jgi:hypothetical protein
MLAEQVAITEESFRMLVKHREKLKGVNFRLEFKNPVADRVANDWLEKAAQSIRELSSVRLKVE